jgi:hypothetical protein
VRYGGDGVWKLAELELRQDDDWSRRSEPKGVRPLAGVKNKSRNGQFHLFMVEKNRVAACVSMVMDLQPDVSPGKLRRHWQRARESRATELQSSPQGRKTRRAWSAIETFGRRRRHVKCTPIQPFRVSHLVLTRHPLEA